MSNAHLASQPAGEARSSGTRLIAVCGFACLVVALQQTLVIPAVPSFPALLGASPVAVSWVVTITLLAGAIATPAIGRLSDLYGRRRMMLLAMCLVLLGSVIATLGGVTWLVIGRALQGAGTALVPVAMAQMRDSLPGARVPGALAVLSATLGVGGGIGIPLGGAILGSLGWQWMFWLSALLSLATVLLIVLVVPAGAPADGGRFDTVGAIGLSISLTLLLLALSQGNSWGWIHPATVGAVVLGLLVLVVWGRHQLRVASPLVDLRTSSRRPVLLTNLASILFGVLMFTNLLLTTLRLQGDPAQGGFGWSAAAAGTAMLPNAAAMLVVAPFAARIAGRFGARAVLVIGGVVTLLGFALAALAPATAALVIAWTTLIGIGVGIGYAALPMLIAQHAPPHEMGAAQGVNALMRAVGTSIASALVATITTSLTATVAGDRVPSAAALWVVAGIGIALAAAATIMAASVPGRSRSAEGRSHPLGSR